MMQHGYNGILYREGEFCIVSNSQENQVILKICEIFPLKIVTEYEKIDHLQLKFHFPIAKMWENENFSIFCFLVLWKM